MDVRKTIAELTSHLSEINYDSEEDNLLIRDSNLGDDSQGNEDFEVEPSNLRKRNHLITLPEQVYGGKTTTRQKTFSLSEASANETDEDDLKHVSDASDFSDQGSEEGSVISDEGRGSDEVYSSGPDDSEHLSSGGNKSINNDAVDCNIYSEKSRSVPSDVKKGTAIINQLRIWDSLLECRIKLQKALSAGNELPTKQTLSEVKSELESDDKLKLNKCKRNLLLLLDKMINVQKDLLKQCDEMKSIKDMKSFNLNEEIPSDESEIEDENTPEDDQPPVKKRKLKDYSNLIKDTHAKFIPFRNASIQKWNDKTKVSSGKMANSNFSAFDQSTLKQIEQVMADKIRLVNRTRIKRSNLQTNTTTQEVSQDAQGAGLDVEIFDDTDFYHKLLRDYIERKSGDVTNSSHTERQMIELQKLRSKMKKAVDTKSTKGRKLRYVVLPKLVNFMAPDPYFSTWSEQAETELYNSLFRSNKV